MNLRIFVAFFLFVTLSNGYKVLFMGTFNGKSHFLYMSAFVKALLQRGHEVTFITSQSMNQNITNYTEILIDPPFDLEALFPQDILLQMNADNPFMTIVNMASFTSFMNSYSFGNPNVQKLIHSTDQHFDVVINEEFFADSWLMFAHKFKAPIITICPFGITNYVDQQMGMITPISIAPHWMLPYTDKMSFTERWYNAVITTFDAIIRRFKYIPTEESIAQKFFAHLAPLPPLTDLMSSISVMFVNNHRALSPPRPAMPGTVSIGGAHIKEPKPLPKDLQEFLDKSKNGVIYFSLGTVVQSSKLPREKIQSFLDAFKNLKHNVLWKFEDESLADVPSNVMIRKWMPQNDILAHPNVVLFISHGGLFGTSESLYYGVPLLLIPFFGDQHRNAHRIATAGYGKFIPFAEVTKERVSQRITDLISDKSFLTKAKQTSEVFKHNLVHPMDEAMFWIEHVCKFNGAKHLKSHATKMSWFTYLSFDILIVSFTVILSILFAIYYLLRKIFTKKKINSVAGKKQN